MAQAHSMIKAQRTPTSQSDMKIAIIGGGTSGLLCLATLNQLGLKPIVFERTCYFGGIWSLGGHHSVYPGLKQNTSSKSMSLDGMTVPDCANNQHCTAADYADYIKNFVCRQNLRSAIRLQHDVIEILRHSSGYSLVLKERSRSCETRLDFDHIIYAIGTCGQPWLPHIQELETFAGEQLHVSNIGPADAYRGRSVMIVGLGNSGADLAITLRPFAKRITLSSQNPTWILPRIVGGQPVDQHVTELRKIHGQGYTKILRDDSLSAGAFFWSETSSMPDTLDFKTCRIVINDSLGEAIKKRRVKIVGKIDSLTKDGATLVSGESVACDTIIYATGYRADPPKLSGLGLCTSELVASVLHPEHSGFWFAGLTPIWGSNPSVTRLQSKLIGLAIKQQRTRP